MCNKVCQLGKYTRQLAKTAMWNLMDKKVWDGLAGIDDVKLVLIERHIMKIETL